VGFRSATLAFVLASAQGGPSGRGLGGLFFGRERHHRGFSSAVDYRGRDMDHSGALEKQANSAISRQRRWGRDWSAGGEIGTK